MGEQPDLTQYGAAMRVPLADVAPLRQQAARIAADEVASLIEERRETIDAQRLERCADGDAAIECQAEAAARIVGAETELGAVERVARVERVHQGQTAEVGQVLQQMRVLADDQILA